MDKYTDKVDKLLSTKFKRPCISDVISVKDFQNSWLAFINPQTEKQDVEDTRDVHEEIKKSMKITDNQLYYSLHYDCDPDNMDCNVKNTIPITTPITPMGVYNSNGTLKPIEGIDLMTVSLQVADMTKRSEDAKYRITTRKNFKDHPFDIIVQKNIATSDVRDIPETEVLLEVHIYRPAKLDSDFNKYYAKKSSSRCMVSMVLEQYIVLGSQKLTVLKDQLYCLSNEIRTKEMSDLKQPLPPKAKDVYKSGFFYINGTFYNDLRDAENKDYSQTVIDWAETHTPEFGPYEKRKMEETTFMDLKLKLGYPYVYQHQGDCEHIIMFHNIRMINKDDTHNSSDYPFLLTKRRGSAICMLCRENSPKWVTIGNERVYDEIFFYCSNCFRSYNYTKDGKKIGQFKAYCFEDD